MTNVALIVLDTLRYDAFETHFDWLPGRRFEHAWSTSHWTVPAHVSLFTGRYASEVGIYAGAQTFDCPDRLLAERLQSSGYTTRAFSANPNLSPVFEADRGFDQFELSWRLEHHGDDLFDWDGFIAETREQGPERYAAALKEVLLGDNRTIPSLKHGAKLKLRDTPLGHHVENDDDGASTALELVRDTSFGDDEFLFLNLMEAHSPYDPPAEWKTVDVDVDGLAASLGEPTDDPTDIERAYEDCVRYLSHIYERIFAEVRESFDLIVTVSDHGELLGEHGGWEHLSGIYPELAHVPLSVYDSRAEIVEEVTYDDHSVSVLDVHETILAAAGLTSGPDSRGRNLVDRSELESESVCPDCTDEDRSEGSHDDVLVEYHGIPDRHLDALRRKGFEDVAHRSRWLDGIAVGEYFGYETFEGFEESGESPYEDPQARIRDVVDAIDRRTDVQGDGEIDESVMRQLEDLGYA
ncbi:sulfatase-like hydrolase/transferase [Natrinema halophilum]|uniref:Sulfatase-like hydrolase/transferase n=1 Tax=Natrinema halophilum TaxID=1699371 RepID=A0A7D5GMU7_9EURY|nr:sulfatase-like hydrolase/transferase [Natrinema halophilum]QLG48853.1 sulfatase-like hydrolase/transferase [Natrinema halophilum]